MGEMTDFINAQANGAQMNLDEAPRHPPEEDTTKDTGADLDGEKQFAEWCDAHMGFNIRDPVTVGHRHDFLLKGAEALLTFYGDEEKAFDLFMKYLVPRCDPPLSGDRVDGDGVPLEWKDAVKYWKETISSDPDYVEHDDYVESVEAQKDEAKISAIVSKIKKQKNGKTFTGLYDDGKIKPYANQRKALEAMASMIAFRTGPDANTIDMVIRSSALYDAEQWKGEYRDKVIEAGIKGCQGEYHRENQEHPPFVLFNDVTGAPYVDAALLAGYVRENLIYIFVRDSGKQGVLKYVYEPTGVYKLYSDDMFKGKIKEYISDYDESLISMRTVNEAFQNLITDLNYIPHDDLNADEALINFENGLLRISADNTELIEHSPKVLSTIQIPCNWTGTQTETPEFDKYMKTLTDGDPNVEFLVLQIMGAVLSNVKCWRMKKAVFFVGPGDTGKSVVKSLEERLIGRGNFIGIDLAEIEARFGTGAIFGTRLAGSSDMSYLSVSELKTFKKITGGDSLFAEFKGQQAFEYTYSGLLWFAMNKLPRFGGDDGRWVYDRIMVIECPNVIPAEEQDKELLDKLYAEREGIVFKAITAFQTVIANGYRFSEPQSVLDARDQYERENNSVMTFWNECMCEWPDGKIDSRCTTGTIYRVYLAWCNDCNHGFHKNEKDYRDTLTRFLDANSYEDLTVRRSRGIYFSRYGLNDEAIKLYQRIVGYADW